MGIASTLFSKVAQHIPLELMRPFSGAALVVPFYHVVSDDAVPHVSHLYRFRNTAEFEKDLNYLLKHFQPVALADIIDALDGKGTLKRPSFHLTFDDGFKEAFEIVAPILLRAGVPATFFLNTAFLNGGGIAHHNAISLLIEKMQSRPSCVSEAALQKVSSLLPPATGNQSDHRTRLMSIPHAEASLVSSIGEILEVDFALYVREVQPYLTSAQIAKLMEMGFNIGAHSHDHPLYAKLPLSAQIQQTRTSIDLLKTNFRASIDSFAFPYNDDAVEQAFFEVILNQSSLAVTFGTSGLVPHFHSRNIQRVGMEKSDYKGNSVPIGRILARQFVRATYRRFRSRDRQLLSVKS